MLIRIFVNAGGSNASQIQTDFFALGNLRLGNLWLGNLWPALAPLDPFLPGLRFEIREASSANPA
jgi:hypothetical protein